MMDCEFTSSHDDRRISTASSLLPYNYTLYCTPGHYDYVSAERSPSPRDESACAVHSSVIVRRQSDRETQRRWLNSCCKVATEPVERQYGDEDGVGGEYVMVNSGEAGYTSVIVATHSGAH